MPERKRFSVGVVAMAAKPPHRAHVGLIERAARECEAARAFVSTGDRSRPGELAVTWEDLEQAWSEIQAALPSNARVEFVAVPVRAAYELVERLDDRLTIAIYGRGSELARNFARMPSNVTLVDATEGGISGTSVRAAVARGDFAEFERSMPAAVDARALWLKLRSRLGES